MAKINGLPVLKIMRILNPKNPDLDNLMISRYF